MIDVPVSTPDKPLTPIDFIACLEQCGSHTEVAHFAERCPLDVRQDERFTRAVAKRLADIKANKEAA